MRHSIIQKICIFGSSVLTRGGRMKTFLVVLAMLPSAALASPVDCYPAAKSVTNYPAMLCAGAESDAPVSCFAAAKGLTDYPALLCAGASSNAPVECFKAAKGLTQFPALLCSGAKDNSPVTCFNASKGLTDNPAILCSPNAAFKAVTREDIDASWNLPYPMRFPNPYPFRYPFPDLN